MKSLIKKICDRFEASNLLIRAAILVCFTLSLAGTYYLLSIVPLQKDISKIDKEIILIRAENQKLQIENDAEEKRFDQFKKELLATRDAKRALKEVLKFDHTLRFIDMHGEGSQSFEKSNSKTNVGTKAITIKFVGSYFSVLNYLKILEQMPIEIYWEYFNYHVTNYPEAEIVLRIHMVDNE